MARKKTTVTVTLNWQPQNDDDYHRLMAYLEMLAASINMVAPSGGVSVDPLIVNDKLFTWMRVHGYDIAPGAQFDSDTEIVKRRP